MLLCGSFGRGLLLVEAVGVVVDVTVTAIGKIEEFDEEQAPGKWSSKTGLALCRALLLWGYLGLGLLLVEAEGVAVIVPVAAIGKTEELDKAQAAGK